ncbi:pol [Symbiodinium sp. CCMP2592]|nr:pol [Symbiodinium sp. CCMP2592]
MEPASGSVKKLDKTALEGLDARTESTKVPEDVVMEEPDPPSDNETMSTAKRSNSKPEHGRGPLREAKQAKKALIHKGIISKEEADKMPHEEILKMVKKYRKGSGNLTEALLEQLAENQKEDLFKKLFGEFQESPGMKMPEISDEQVMEADKVLTSCYKNEKCPFCDKYVDEYHVQNKDHKIYMKEHLKSSYLLTDPSAMTPAAVRESFTKVRRFGGGLHRLSLANSVEYWGDVEKLPSLVRSIHATKAMKVKYGKSTNAKTFDFTKEQVAKYHLAWVSYAPKSGKYTNASYSKDHLPEDPEFENMANIAGTQTILIICWYQIMEDGFWVWVMTIEEEILRCLWDIICKQQASAKVLSRVMIPAVQACMLNNVVTNNSGQDENKFTASVDIAIRILLSWFRRLKVNKKKREAAFRRLSEAEKAKVTMVMEKIELNDEEAEEAAKDEAGSDSDVDLTFMVSLDSLCTTNTAVDHDSKTSVEIFASEESSGLHRMFDNVLKSPSTPPLSGGAPSGSAPCGSDPCGSAPSGAASSGAAAAEQPVTLSNLDLIALARSRRPAFTETKTASGSKPKASKAKAKAKAKAKGKAQATAVVKKKLKSKAVQKKPAAAVAKAVPSEPAAAVAKAVPGQAEQIFTAPDGAEYMFMMYDRGVPTERIAICEWLGTKRGCQLLQVSRVGLASEARAAIARELMDMLVAGKSLQDVIARKLELLSAQTAATGAPVVNPYSKAAENVAIGMHPKHRVGEDLGLVIGGWTDARSHEAEEEVRNMFRAAKSETLLEALSGPSGRTNFLRVTLAFPENASLPRKRQIQKDILDTLKAMKCRSGIEGQNEVELWIQRDRAPTLPSTRDGVAYETVTGRAKETLQQAWLDYGPASTPMGAGRRYHDLICLCADLNYDILDIARVDERGIPFGRLLRELGLSHSKPAAATWRNTRGAQSRLDFFLFSLPSMSVRDDRVLEGSEEIIGSDHSAVTLTLETIGRSGRRRFANSPCGKWWTDVPQFTSKCEQLAEELDLSMQDLTMARLEAICQQSSKRVTSCRYQDSPELKQLARERKLLRGQQARQLAKRIADERKAAKRAWLSNLLEQGAGGDFRALSYFKKRNSSAYTQGSYCMRAGGSVRAVSDLRAFYRLKYTQHDQVPRGLAMAIFRGRTGPIGAPVPFTLEEIQEVAFQCKHNKSTGTDGISYEAIQLLLQTSLSTQLLELFNDVFTKALMIRLRPKLPKIQACQVGGLPGRQTLDSACAVQHAIRLAQQYDKTLYVVKLDITAAFDSVSHEALAALLATTSGSREAEILLELITNTRVELSLQGSKWEQCLTKGILQGSSYSAELFARCIDFFLTPTQERWQDTESSWLADEAGLKLFLTPFADDLVLLGTSREQTQKLLRDCEETLQAIGLHFNAKKCKFLHSPGASESPFRLQSGLGVEAVDTMVFLGVLLGFQLSCVSVLAARMAKVSNAFWGYFRILRQAGVGLTQRLRVFDCFITARWRWMSPTARPLQTVRTFLKRAHTTFLTAILGFTRDPFQGSVDAWLSRRRASRAAAQCVQHKKWEAIQAQSFWTYWGHAARYDEGDRIPLRLMIQVRGPAWLLRNHTRIRRAKPGRAPDSSRFIQLDRWRDFVKYWLEANSCSLTKYYELPLQHLDLRGRMLLQNGDVFSLLPVRHVPVETAHPSSFLCVDLEPEARITDPGQSEHLLRVFSDGSAPQGRHAAGPGGGAVVILPPYGNIQDAIVSYFRIPGPCSNIEAEVRAAAHALRMIQEIRRRFPQLPVQFCTDSQYVLQVMNGDFIGTHYASATNDLLCRWSQLSCYVQACHVRAHKGFLLNEVADHYAKKARTLTHSCTVYHTHSMSRAAVVPHTTGIFVPWLA